MNCEQQNFPSTTDQKRWTTELATKTAQFQPPAENVTVIITLSGHVLAANVG